MNNYVFIGIVRAGRFKPLAAEHETSESMRLTTAALQPNQSPESGQISLVDYDGSAILVRGIDTGEWIYSAVIIEQAGAILTSVVQEVFSLGEKATRFRLQYPLA